MNRPPDPRPPADRTAVQQTDPPADTQAAGGAELPRFGPPGQPGDLGTLGRYRVLRLLGKGGMGAVYKAHDPRLARDVALKVMLPGAAGSPQARERFLREARAAARVQHDHVIGIIDADEADGTPYIAMPYLKGYPLDEYLKKKGRPPLPQVLRLVREMADGLAAAHALGIVHRDVKPGNVWLEAPHGRVKLLDFGLAKPADEGGAAGGDLTRTGALLGTPAYMAPEQGAGEHVDYRADLFSLGCVLYRLLCDEPPFARANMMATLTALAAHRHVPVRTKNPDVPPAVAQLVDELLEKAPAARPKSAAAVVERLRAAERAAVAVTSPAPGGPPAAGPASLEVTAGPSRSVFEELVDDGPVESVNRSAVREPTANNRALLIGAAAAGGLAVVALVGFLLMTPGKKEPAEAKADDPAVERKKTPPPRPPAPKGPPKPTGPLVAEADLRPVPAAAPKGPFDELDPATIPAAERYPWLPKEAVAVLGSTRGWVADAGQPAAVSPDGRWVVRAHPPAAVLDAATLRPALMDPRVSFNSLAFSPDGKTAAVGYAGGEHGVRLIDLSGPAPKPLRTVANRPENGTHGIAFLDARTLATGTGHGGVHLWDLDGPADSPKATVRPVNPRPDLGVSQLTASRDGRRLAGYCPLATEDNTPAAAVIVWDLSGPTPAEATRVPVDPTTGRVTAALAPDGRTLVIGIGAPNEAGRLEVWDVAGPTPAKKSAVEKLTYPWVIGFAADGSLACRHAVYTLTDGTLKRSRVLPANVVGMAPDLSKFVLSAGRRIGVVDAAGNTLAAPGDPAGEEYPVVGPGVLFSVPGRPAVWTVADKGLLARPLPDPLGGAVAGRGVQLFPKFNADGSLLAGLGADLRVYVYAAGDPPREVTSAPDERNNTVQAGRVAGYSWLPDGGLAVRTQDGTVARYDPAAPGTPGKVITEGPDGPSHAFAVHPAGRLFAWVAADGGLVLLRPGESAGRPDERVIPVPAGEPRFNVIEFSADGRHLYAANGKLRRFDLTKPEPAEELVLGSGCEWFFRSADGAVLVTHANPGDGPTIAWRDGGTLKVLGEFRPPGYSGYQLAPDGRHLATYQSGCTAILRLR